MSLLHHATIPSILLLTLVSAPGAAQTRVDNQPDPKPLTADQWRADLDSMMSGLRQVHANVHHHVSAASLDSAAAAIRTRIPGLARHQIIMEFARLAALVGDGHTNVAPTRDAAVQFRELPIALYAFEDGLFVRAARREMPDLVGARVLRIGEAEAADALARVTPYIGRDNAMGALFFAPHLLVMPEVLHALGLSPSPDSARFDVEIGGRRRTVWLSAAGPTRLMAGDTDRSWRPRAGWLDARDATPGPDPPWLREPPDTVLWWFQTLPGTSVVYAQVNQVRDAEREPFDDFVARLFARLDGAPVDRLVLDLRLNRGGNGELLAPLVRGLLRRPQVNTRGRLFVLTGRATWSAAQFLLDDLDAFAEVIFVGEPSASKGNHYGDSRRIPLPNCGVTVRASTRWWQHWLPGDARPWRGPDVAAPLTFVAYRTKRDPVLEAAVQWRLQPPLAEHLAALLARGDTAAARARVRMVRRDPATRYVDALDALQDAGAQLYRRRDVSHAAAAFVLAASEYPDAASAHLRAGLVLAELGRASDARRELARALELDPENATARERLKSLTGR